MTKSDLIWALLQEGLDPVDIAARVGCRPQYVYVVRQRKNSPDGRTPSERAWRKENREENLEKMRINGRQWYWERGGKEKMAAWVEANRDRRNARRREWRLENPDKMIGVSEVWQLDSLPQATTR
jgi:hypothetical protein